MTQIKYYDSSSGSWKAVVAGPSGAPGIVTSATAPTDTSILWMDTTSSATQLAVPSGGSAGQVLIKSSNTDYATAWVDDTRAAGKNAIINGGFDFWQRGTSFSTTAAANGLFVSDRWKAENSSTTGLTVSQQTFTPGTAPVAGYEGTYFLRYAATSAASVHGILQPIEDVRTFAGQTVTLSAWMKASAATSLTPIITQVFGTGGSSAVDAGYGFWSITTSWQRFTWTVTIPSVAGKTIGANSYLNLRLLNLTNTAFTIDIWGVQLEAGSVATPFTRAGGTLQGELAACQRYYQSIGGDSIYQVHGTGTGNSTTAALIYVPLLTKLRAVPTSVEFSTLALSDSSGAVVPVTSGTIEWTSTSGIDLRFGVASGLTQFRPYFLHSNNSLSAYLRFSAEL